MEITEDMIQINTLYGFENVKGFYYLNGYDVYNIMTGHIKTISRLNKVRYPYVSLEQYNNSSPKKVMMHQLIALAYINNGPFILVEHLDDNILNYNTSNLMFSDKKSNAKRAFENGHTNKYEYIYEVVTKNGKSYTGTMKELSEITSTPRQTLYCIYYENRSGRKIESIIKVGQQTIEKIPAA